MNGERVFSWGHQRRFNAYSNYSRKIFKERLQKVSVDAGFTCPNRDGTKAKGGCTFCNNSSFNPGYCQSTPAITDQINKGINFFKDKYDTQQYLAYFQAYSNTYGQIQELKKKYEEALSHPMVKGIAVGTRPDCVNDDILDYLAELNEKYEVVVEYGVESTKNETLDKINRCHTYEESVEAIEATAKRNIPVGIHIILGLPEETLDDIYDHADKINRLPIHSMKMHQLQIIKGALMAKEYHRYPERFSLFTTYEEYMDVVIQFLERLRPGIIMERFISQSYGNLLIAPKWGIKNFEFVSKLEREMETRDTWQGKLVGEKSRALMKSL